MKSNQSLESFCLGLSLGIVIGSLFIGYVMHKKEMKERYQDCVMQQYKSTPEAYRDMDYIHTYCEIVVY